ncbi:hypothetical protein [Streptomyces albidoflavus]|uniref:hypothetical protein n=1 Tax=Streptomyces albidoflavus TaxID=1886 RepID=UPI0033C1F161
MRASRRRTHPHPQDPGRVGHGRGGLPLDGLDAPGAEAWENQNDWEIWLEVPVQAVRELIEEHGGEHAEQDRRTYRVTVLRTERIEFAVEADSREDAEARYLADGVEVASETDSTSVESVTVGQQ